LTGFFIFYGTKKQQNPMKRITQFADEQHLRIEFGRRCAEGDSAELKTADA
jgi:hypothetical protein